MKGYWIAALLALPVAGRCDEAIVRTIVDLQAARRSAQVELVDAAGGRGSLELTEPNPRVDAWHLLTLRPPGRREAVSYHLESADPGRQPVALDPARPGQLTVGAGPCVLWPGDALERARRSALPYAPLCGGRLYLRNPVPGNRTALEATTDFLRDHVWRGEDIVGFVRREFFRDAYVEAGTPASGRDAADAPGVIADAPPAGRVEAARAAALVPQSLGLDVGARALWPGRWYAARGLDGVYVSAAPPGAMLAPTGAAESPQRRLDAVESEALAYLVAFDLARHELGFALGTEHPRLGWSARVREGLRDPNRPGPDGIATAAPLARTGMVSPALAGRTVAAFTGGFKREHGAFRYGALAMVNQGSHYGFVEQGVVFSTLQPGLATLFVLDDGSVDMKTWGRDDDRLLGRIRHARQNGVALLERGPAGGAAVFGPLVDQWGPGNWSGSADENPRTVRAGACLIDAGPRRFLVYGYFSTATPRAMARVFAAYGCRYAMHLDMNALEHTYLALYPRRGTYIEVEHLVQGMSVLDKTSAGALVPRFLGYADDRDFFYLLRRRSAP